MSPAVIVPFPPPQGPAAGLIPLPLAQLLDQLPQGIVVVWGDEIVYANGSLARALGHPVAAELAGRSVAELVHPFDRHQLAERARREDVAWPDGEWRAMRRDGGMAHLRASHLRWPGENDLPVELVSLEDVTLRKQTEERLDREARLATLGSLAGGLAGGLARRLEHATSCLAGAQAEMVMGRADGKVADALGETRRDVERLAGLLSALDDLSHGSAEPEGRADVSKALERVARVVAFSFGDRAWLALDVRETPPVDADPTLLGELLLALLVCAARAVPDGHSRTLRVVAGRDRSGRAQVEVSDAAPDPRARLVWPSEDLERCGRLVRALDGELQARALPGGASLLRLTLPAAAAEARPTRRVS